MLSSSLLAAHRVENAAAVAAKQTLSYTYLWKYWRTAQLKLCAKHCDDVQFVAPPNTRKRCGCRNKLVPQLCNKLHVEMDGRAIRSQGGLLVDIKFNGEAVKASELLE